MATGFGAGYKVLCGVGKESVWGTAVAPAELIPILNESLNETEEWIQNEVLKGKAGRKTPVVGGLKASGGLSVRGNYQETDLLMALLFGGGAGVPTGSGPWVHTLSLSADILKSLSVHVEKDVNVHTTTGIRFNSGTLVIEPGIVRWDFDCTGKLVSRATTHRAALAALVDAKVGNLLYHQATLRIGDLANALAVGDVVDFSSVNVVISHNLATDHRGAVSGKYALEARRSGRREVTMSVTLPRFKESAFIDFQKAETPLQADITITDGTNIHLFEFPTLKIMDSDAAVGGPEIIPHTFTLQAAPNESNSFITETEECVLTITNQRSTAIWS